MSPICTERTETASAEGAGLNADSLSVAAAAGIADAGSCISLVRQRNADGTERHRLVLHITRNEDNALAAFRGAVGIAGVVRQIRIGHLTYQRLAYEGRKAYDVIKVILPYLRERQLEAAAALRYWELGRHGVAFGPAGVPADIRAIRLAETLRFEALKLGLKSRSRKPSAARRTAKN